MPPMKTETTPGFWRCRKCGTPNPRAVYLTKCLGCGQPIPHESASSAVSASETKETAGLTKPRGQKTLVAAAIYAGIVLGSVGMIRGMALGWWLVAALVFLPRSLFLVPILPLVIGAIRARRGTVLALVAIDGLLVLGPLMGFSIPFGSMLSDDSNGPRVRIMTLNQGGTQLDVPRLIRYVERYRIDIICFQELGSNSDLYESLRNAGWHVDANQRISSRFPIVRDLGRTTDVNKSDSRYTMTFFRARLKHPDGFEFFVGSAHLPAPRRGLAYLMARDFEKFEANLSWWDEEAGRLRESIAELSDAPMLVAGDFNMPSDYNTMAAIRSDHPSAYEEAGWGYGFTRPTMFPWVRIDHVLGTRDWAFRRCWIGPDFGSDHLPLIAEAVLVNTPPGP
jgi:vancomycin resistance protein VanJ